MSTDKDAPRPAAARDGAPWCDRCPLRRLACFRDFAPDELAVMMAFKREHRRAAPGDELLRQGDPTPRLLTLFTGWAAGYQGLPSGEQQLLSVLLPGDLIGAGSLHGVPQHAVRAITDVTYCVLDEQHVGEVMSRMPSLGQRLVHAMALHEEHLNLRLTHVGACDARKSAAVFLLDLQRRLAARGMTQDGVFPLPLTQEQLAEALGVTVVHLGRILRWLRENGIVTLRGGRAVINDLDRLRHTACIPEQVPQPLPLL